MARGLMAAAAAAAWITILAGCAPDAEPDRPAAAPGEGYVDGGDGVLLHYRVWGSAGDTVVVLHGGAGLDSGYLAPDLEPLSESHVLIFYDQRGAGRSTLVSDAASLHIDRHVADVDAVRRHFGIERVALLGHSWGSLLASRYARVHPDRVSRLVIHSPAPLRRSPYWDGLVPHVTRWMDAETRAELDERNAARRDPGKDPRAACRGFWELFFPGYFYDPLDRATLERSRADFCTAQDAALRNGLVAGPLTWESIGEWDWREDFREVRAPVLVITGTRDIFPEEAMREWAEAFPESRLVLLERAGHYPHVERPEAFFSIVRAFLVGDPIPDPDG